MPDDAQRIGRVLSLMDRRLSRVEETIGREDSIPNQLMLFSDRTGGQDSATQSTASPSKFVWDTGAWDQDTWS